MPIFDAFFGAYQCLNLFPSLEIPSLFEAFPSSFLHHATTANITEGYIGKRSLLRKHKLLDSVGRAIIKPTHYNWIKLFWYGCKTGIGKSEIDGSMQPANPDQWLVKHEDYMKTLLNQNEDSHFHTSDDYL